MQDTVMDGQEMDDSEKERSERNSTEQSLQTDSPIFEIQKSNAREIFPLIKTLVFRDLCTISIMHDGIRIAVDDVHSQAAVAYLKYELFSEYNLKVPHELHFAIPINSFIETLNVFPGNNATMKMSCQNAGDPLTIIMEQDEAVFRSMINTQKPQPMLEFGFEFQNIQAKLMMKPTSICHIFREFDPSSENVLITVTKDYISFYTKGDLGQIKTQIWKKSDQVELLEISPEVERVQHYYRLAHIRRMINSLSISNKMNIRIDHRGVMNVQYIVILTEQQNSFIEFLTIPESDVYSE